MVKMKRFKKILALGLSLAMSLGMSVTSFAANGDGKRDKDDTATVTISGLEKAVTTKPDGSTDESWPTVTLYRIAKGNYTADDFKGFSWAADNLYTEVEVTEDGKTVKQIQVDIEAAAAGLQNKSITQLTERDGSNGVVAGRDAVNDQGVYTATVHAGAYIAVITGGGKVIYNPVLLTAAYGEGTDLDNGSVDLDADDNTYLYGSSAVAKKSEPGVEKEVTVDKSKKDGDKNTASVGTELTYTVTPTMPSYPVNATNKTVYVTDTMSDGLTFKFDTLTVAVAGKTMNEPETANGVMSFSYGEDENKKVVATAVQAGNGFRLVFDYNQLVQYDNDNKTTGSIDQPTVTYKAVLNDNAVVGGSGNTNTVNLKYTNSPYTGTEYTDPTKPEPEDNIETVTKGGEDKNTVYTYQLAFMKVDPGAEDATTDDKTLPGATFGIYTSGTAGTVTENGTVSGNPIDTVVTNDQGYAVSGKVAAGTYYIKELVAPPGYSLSEKVYEVEVSYATATTTATMKETTYTTEVKGPQAGWLKVEGENKTFKSFSEYAKLSEDEKAGYAAAYVEKESIQVSSVETTSAQGAGTAYLNTRIPNTKLASLPSTGGIGTTIFTVGGCALMIIAAGLYFAARRKNAK